MMRPSTPLLFLLLLSLAMPAFAQRHALGDRLAKLEEAWMARRDEPGRAARRRALPAVKGAVGAFFSFRLVTAAEKLDEARLALDGEASDAARLCAAGFGLQVARRLIDPRAGEWLEARLDRLYGTEDPELSLTVGIATRDADTGEAIAALELRVTRDEKGRLMRLRFPPDSAARDAELLVTLHAGARLLDTHRERFALVPDLERRLAALPVSESSPGWRAATTVAGSTDLAAWRAGTTPENEPRPLARLRSLEALNALPEEAPLPAGEWLLALPRSRGTHRLRLAVPEGATKDSPLLVLAHGAGGSENMFFEALGAGIYVREGLARGAIVVAPRLALMGGLDLEDLLAELARVRPYDRDRVFLVGHSMGAMRLLGAATRTERPFAALCALAGGRPGRNPEGLARTPLFCGSADGDFSRGGVLALAEAVGKIEGATCELKVVEDSEHLLAVADLAPAVFDFLGRQGLRLPDSSNR